MGGGGGHGILVVLFVLATAETSFLLLSLENIAVKRFDRLQAVPSFSLEIVQGAQKLSTVCNNNLQHLFHSRWKK